MVFRKNKRGQAAIEFLMTYGWMLLVVLIVGALIFSFVDFGSLLPNKLDLSNNLRGDPTGSVAYSHDTPAPDTDRVKVVFRYTGAKRAIISAAGNTIATELGDTCTSEELRNLDTGGTVVNTDADPTTAFLNGHDGLMTFDCSNITGGLLNGDSVVGDIFIKVKDPKTQLDVPSTGSIRLQVITG
jgi:Flp pilus assembly protein TadG